MEGQICTTPSNNPGICKALSACSILYNPFLIRPLSKEYIELMTQSQCATQKDGHYVCCPQNETLDQNTKTTTVSPNKEDPLNSHCRDASFLNGTCVVFKNCKKLFDIYNATEPLSPRNRQFLRNSQCGYYNKKAYVCCSSEVSQSETLTDDNSTQTSNPANAENFPWLKYLRENLPQPPHCGRDSKDYIFGGKVTKLDEFPWMVLLEFEKCVFVDQMFVIFLFREFSLSRRGQERLSLRGKHHQ